MKKLIACLFLMAPMPILADVAAVITIEDPFARAAIQQQRNSAAFMKLGNKGADAAIVYAKSPVADIVELHTHVNDQGVMRMRKIERIELPAQQTVTLKPGGLHVMLLGLNQDLKVGQTIEVTLGFSDSSEKTIEVPVKMVQRPMMKGHGKNHDKKQMMTH
ncbi:MAG: copper chaperone PCu(A)C [Gammaproteobacteria bacterium]|nr:copper chaperone PCu(A)C [Gammaproteobacteria bacterium]